ACSTSDRQDRTHHAVVRRGCTQTTFTEWWALMVGMRGGPLTRAILEKSTTLQATYPALPPTWRTSRQWASKAPILASSALCLATYLPRRVIPLMPNSHMDTPDVTTSGSGPTQ